MHGVSCAGGMRSTALSINGLFIGSDTARSAKITGQASLFHEEVPTTVDVRGHHGETLLVGVSGPSGRTAARGTPAPPT